MTLQIAQKISSRFVKTFSRASQQLTLGRIARAVALIEMLEARTLLSAAPTFNFTLPQTQQTSAEVFKADGTLLRTLWSGVSYNAGTRP